MSNEKYEQHQYYNGHGLIIQKALIDTKQLLDKNIKT